MPLPHKERWRTSVNLFRLPLWTLLPFAKNPSFFQKKKGKEDAHKVSLSQTNFIS
jgi:hypothetical protein